LAVSLKGVELVGVYSAKNTQITKASTCTL